MSDTDPRIVAYRAGLISFMGVEMLIARGALIPRAETELLGQTALKLLAERAIDEPRVIDMCCGSGNLACAIAHRHPQARVWATDLTDGAVAVARSNVSRLGLSERVTVLQGDLFESLDGLGLEGTVNLVVCNPPYISTGKLAAESANLLEHEPREAFDGGPYGVSIFQKVVRAAPRFLKPEGVLAFEIGVGQERQVEALFERTKQYGRIEMVIDGGGQARVIFGRTPTVLSTRKSDAAEGRDVRLPADFL